ncbi:TetR/AcrR family transcriptional regulator [Rhodococcus sp. NPDC056960]|uniref:TetR/AcrR family transcriptional regulator n=1 Tax=Rhodococcus sp. NPDC056960 TaxID=3345982 RepID=UPI0036289413
MDTQRARPGRPPATAAAPDTRLALLEATIRVVGRGGLRSLTYRAVAAEAGLTHGMVSHHFGSRDALIEAALKHALEVTADVLYSEITEGDSVETFLDRLTDIVARDPDMQVFQYELMFESRRNPALAPQARMLYDTVLSATRDALVKVGVATDDSLTLLVYAALDGLMMQQLIMGNAEASNNSLARLRQMLAKER